MKSSVLNFRTLAVTLDRIPMKEIPTVADVRKCSAVVDILMKATEEDLKMYDAMQKDIQDYAQEKKKKIDAEKDEKKKQKMVEASNEEAKPMLKERDDLMSKQIEVELDANYVAFVKSVFEKSIHPQIASKKVLVELADLLGL